jgi:hypothetical protein
MEPLQQTPAAGKPVSLAEAITHKRLPLPPGWRTRRAKDLFDLRRPLTAQVYDLDQIPEWMEIAEQAEQHRQRLPEFRFPELYAADQAAHVSFYQHGIRAPLPEGWQRYNRTLAEWQIRGYGTEQIAPEQQQQEPASKPNAAVPEDQPAWCTPEEWSERHHGARRKSGLKGHRGIRRKSGLKRLPKDTSRHHRRRRKCQGGRLPLWCAGATRQASRRRGSRGCEAHHDDRFADPLL